MFGNCTPALAATSTNGHVSIPFPPRFMSSRFGAPYTDTNRSGRPSLLTSPHALPFTKASTSMPTLCDTSVKVPSQLLRYSSEGCELPPIATPDSLPTNRQTLLPSVQLPNPADGHGYCSQSM